MGMEQKILMHKKALAKPSEKTFGGAESLHLETRAIAAVLERMDARLKVLEDERRKREYPG